MIYTRVLNRGGLEGQQREHHPRGQSDGDQGQARLSYC
jgi:hypothetical protein